MNPILNKVLDALSPRRMEYLAVDRNLLIVETSWGAQRFAECSNEVRQGNDVRLGFPELIGIENLLAAILEGKKVNFELKGISRFLDHKQPLYIDLYIIGDQEPGGYSEKLIIVFEDVTEKMVLQQTLVQRVNETSLLASALDISNQYIEKIITSMADALLVTTSAGNIKRVNKIAQELFEYSECELINEEVTNIIDKDNLLFQSSQQHRLTQGEFLHDVEAVCKTKTGKEITVAFSCSAIETGIKDLHDFVYVGRDITLAKQAEEKIKQLNQDLEQRAIALEVANKELEAFSYSVSHDLRAPLRSIDGFSHILLEEYAEQLDAIGQDYLQRVRASAHRMGHLIDDLLSLSRVSKSEMCCMTVDLSAIVLRIVRELQKNQPERQVVFVIAPSVLVQGDAGLLRIALENLLNNAWKFTAQQPSARIEFGKIHGEWELDTESHEAEDWRQEEFGNALPSSTPIPDRVVYFVRDNGAGFDMAYSSKLFGAFQRLHTSQEFEGTGIGLAIVQRIIHRHSGRVWAEGAVGAGATFYFTLGELVPKNFILTNFNYSL